MARTDVDLAPAAIKAMASNVTELANVVLTLVSQVRDLPLQDLVCSNDCSSLQDFNCFKICSYYL